MQNLDNIYNLDNINKHLHYGISLLILNYTLHIHHGATTIHNVGYTGITERIPDDILSLQLKHTGWADSLTSITSLSTAFVNKEGLTGPLNDKHGSVCALQ